MLKKLIVFAITSGLAAKWYKAYASKKHADINSGGLAAESSKHSLPAQL